MASAYHCASPSSQSLLGFHLWSSTHRASIPTISVSGFGSKLAPISKSSRFRSNAAARLQIRRKLSTVFASNPSGGNSVEKASSGVPPQGPPVLTILAGVALFALVFWITRSILAGLVSFLLSLIPFK